MLSPSEARTESAYLSLRGLTKEYGAGPPAVDRLDLDVEQGELMGLLGPSGCGKTTTLRMIAGLIEPTGGTIVHRRRDLTRVPTHQRHAGFMFQSYALFPHMTVARNVAFGLKLRRLPRGEIERRVADALRLVKLEGLGARRPSELSGGQQQRVALARALVIEPDFLLLDEPLSNLDAKLRETMRNEIRDIQQRLGITTVLVTHDQSEALSLCDRIAVMREGHIEQIGTPLEIYERPATRFVAGFVGRINELACSIEGRDGDRRLVCDGQPIPTPPGLPAAARAHAMVRPHHIRLRLGRAADGPGLAGNVVRRTFVGDTLEIEVDCGGTPVSVELRPGVDEGCTAEAGSHVVLSWPQERTIVFAA
ncbi:MAG TPA: ABC transporter ATP-binding protein [Geminicoccaceae bacterium]|nr:ABC transporter ATP-binding protein [Geminicoccaceae bacterium]